MRILRPAHLRNCRLRSFHESSGRCRACAACAQGRARELLAERTPRGHWVGQIASSPLATAAAISALGVCPSTAIRTMPCARALAGDGQVIEQLVQGDLSELLLESVHWLARHQNPDGGWGDCDAARSNIAATMLVQAAFRLTGIPAKYADLMVRADRLRRMLKAASPARRATVRQRQNVCSPRCWPTVPWPTWCPGGRCPRCRSSWSACRSDGSSTSSTPVARLRDAGAAWPSAGRSSITIRREIRSRGCCGGACAPRAWRSRAAASGGRQFPSVRSPSTAFVVMSLASIGCQEHPIVRARSRVSAVVGARRRELAGRDESRRHGSRRWR